MKKRVLLFFLFITNILCVFSQNRFQEEVNTIQKKYSSIWNKNKETVVFTGSSSIRMWRSVDSIFHKHQIMNTGFGGSQAEDLLHFLDPLVLDYNPTRIFIYEGDNDIASTKKPKEIIKTFKDIITKIQLQNSSTKIFLISTKPSIRRWHLKKEYKRLNRKIKRLSKKDINLFFIDVWKPMLYKSKLNKELFLSDGLHMNAEGYKIWHTATKQHLK